MTVVNPLVRLWVAPVETLTLLGYVLLLASLLVVTVAATWTNVTRIVAQVRAQYPHKWQYRPPTLLVLRVAAVPFVLGVDAMVLGAIVRLLG